MVYVEYEEIKHDKTVIQRDVYPPLANDCISNIGIISIVFEGIIAHE